MTLQPRPGILEIKPYVPGAAAPKGAVKLSSNENALGCSPKAAEAFKAAMEKLHVYPDGGAAKLREAIAEVEKLDPARIVCGSGSDELLQLIGRAYLDPGDKVVQTQYGFLVYRLVAMQSGARIVSAPEAGYTADVDSILKTAGDDAKIVFLANPNNPTGTWIKGSEIRRLRENLPKQTLLVLDGAYEVSSTRRAMKTPWRWWTRTKTWWSRAPSRRFMAWPGFALAGCTGRRRSSTSSTACAARST
ncbi:MAG: histidinol-phosphate transaminase [Oceanicaulis sp.]